MTARPGYTGIILAGERPGPSPVAAAAGVARKVLAEVGAEPMLQHVIRALQGSARVGQCVVVGGASDRGHFAALLADNPRCRWRDGAETPAASVARAVSELAAEAPLLITTGDHPLLAAAAIRQVCDEADSTACDVMVALVRHQEVVRAVPDARCTRWRFRDGAYCGCNVYVLRSAAGRRMPALWQQVEAHRKRPWRIVRTVGLSTLARYACGGLRLEDAFGRLSKRFGLEIAPCILPFAMAALDVDTVDDWRLANRLYETAPASGLP